MAEGFKPTEEQAAAIEVFNTGDNLVLEAGAGTGKTSTLKLMAAEAGKRKRGVYVAYNKAIADDASASFPSNTTCRTAHSFAFRSHGVKFKDRLNGPRMTAAQTAGILGIKNHVQVNKDVSLGPRQITRLAGDTVRRFCYSADKKIAKHHVPFVPGTEAIWESLRELVVGIAENIWDDATKPKGKLRFEHDYYLKMWALSGPELPGDFILFDEAQDANPVISDVVLNQDEAQLIAVGDRCQAIYGWRGAEDAMESWPAKHRLLLSQSFRFGPAVADEANKWLELLEAPLRLTGFEKIDSTVTMLSDPKAILCRTNAGAVSAAIEAHENGRKYALVGGTNEIKRFAEAAMKLQSGQSPDHPELMAFQNWEQVTQYVNEEGGSDLKVFVRLIEAYGVERVFEIAEFAVDERYADTIVSTAHKAKGREWDTVRIGSDFQPPSEEEGGFSRPEGMLAYVAVTRAINKLDREGLDWVDRLLAAKQPPLPVEPAKKENPFSAAKRRKNAVNKNDEGSVDGQSSTDPQ